MQTYCELMQQQVHEQRDLVAEEHIGAVDGAAGTRQVVGVYSSTEGSNRGTICVKICVNIYIKKQHTHLKLNHL